MFVRLNRNYSTRFILQRNSYFTRPSHHFKCLSVSRTTFDSISNKRFDSNTNYFNDLKNRNVNSLFTLEYRSFCSTQDPEALCEKGKRYFHGDGVEKNIDEAVRLFKLASEQGHVESMRLLNEIYPGITKILKLFSVKNDDGTYQYHDEMRDILIEKKPEEIQLIKLAADKGDRAAQAEIAQYYELGLGVEKNKKKAFKYFKLAVKQGDKQSLNRLGCKYEHGLGTEKNMDEALKFYRLSAKAGDAVGQYNVARCYAYGLGVEKNDSEAFKYYKLSAEQGFPYGQCYLGYYYIAGKGVKKDFFKGLTFFTLAAEQGNKLAQPIVNSYEKKGVRIITHNKKECTKNNLPKVPVTLKTMLLLALYCFIYFFETFLK